MKDLQPLLDMYDRGASQEEIRTEAERLGINKGDLELEAVALEAFVAHEDARARVLEALPPLERLRRLVESITHKN
jgi:hypothetical protein